MAKFAIFTLRMPNSGSWNGQWSGSGNKYVVSRELTKRVMEKAENVQDGASHYYNFGDGWGASVSIQIVDGAKAKNAAIKDSRGFSGYDWMVDSILKHGKIISE